MTRWLFASVFIHAVAILLAILTAKQLPLRPLEFENTVVDLVYDEPDPTPEAPPPPRGEEEEIAREEEQPQAEETPVPVDTPVPVATRKTPAPTEPTKETPPPTKKTPPPTPKPTVKPTVKRVESPAPEDARKRELAERVAERRRNYLQQRSSVLNEQSRTRTQTASNTNTGGSAADPRLVQIREDGYKERIDVMLRSAWQIPARLQGPIREALVRIQIQKDGKISSYEFVKRSGHREFDSSVTAVLDRVKLPELPDGVSAPMTVTIRFRDEQ